MNLTSFYTAKSTAIEAVQLTEENMDEVISWLNDAFILKWDGGILMRAPRQPTRAFLGWYVIKEPDGKFKALSIYDFVNRYKPLMS